MNAAAPRESEPAGKADDPEAVLAQALRAMAGGGKPGAPPSGDGDRTSLTPVQVMLVAAIIGVVIGMAAGFTVLVLR